MQEVHLYDAEFAAHLVAIPGFEEIEFVSDGFGKFFDVAVLVVVGGCALEADGNR